MRLLSREESEYMGIAEIMKFDNSVRMTRMNWWMTVIGLMVLQMVAGIVMFIVAAPEIAGTLLTLVVVWVNLGVSVGRLRDRGYTEVMEFALRLIIFPWGFVECGFLAGPEPADE
jgi:uncharacterized membrane protein YhaH (DUF805 family)